MKIVPALCFIGLASAFPYNNGVKPKHGNPDEWGPYYQGDMVFKNPNHRNGLIDESTRWPNAQVAYSYDADFQDDKKPTVEKAMQSYSDLTGGCVTFKVRTTETNYVLITGDDNDGCHSHVGMEGGQQIINYPDWCIDTYGSVQHEMLHTLGFHHEQASPDRDGYVIIKWTNIEEGEAHNFEKCDYDTCTTFGQPYDYDSVMHYSQYAFSRNDKPTIETIDPTYQDEIGQRVGLSTIDISKLMLMYNCPNAK